MNKFFDEINNVEEVNKPHKPNIFGQSRKSITKELQGFENNSREKMIRAGFTPKDISYANKANVRFNKQNSNYPNFKGKNKNRTDTNQTKIFENRCKYYYTDFDFAWLCEKMSSDEISKLHNKYQKIKGTHGSSKSGDPSTQKVMNNLRDKIRSEKGSEGYKQWTSQERLKNRSKIDKDKLNKEGEDILRNSDKVMAKSAKRKFIGGVAGSAVGSIAANNLMKRHHDKKLQTLKDSGASAEEIKKMQRKQLLKRVLVNIGGAAAGNVIGSNIGHLSSGVLKHNKRVKNFSKKVSDYNKKYQNNDY